MECNIQYVLFSGPHCDYLPSDNLNELVSVHLVRVIRTVHGLPDTLSSMLMFNFKQNIYDYPCFTDEQTGINGGEVTA